MSGYYLDASALVKRYVDETGSDWLRATMAPAQHFLLFTSRMVIVEVISAFARRIRDGSLTPGEFTVVRDAFRFDCLNESDSNGFCGLQIHEFLLDISTSKW
jgi:predicted nucleic acid-binding protein